MDTILGLLFFVFFVVLPLFSRGARGKKGQQGKGQAPGTGKATGQGAGGAAPGQGSATARPSASTSTTQDTPSVTLAEIRRRVEDAQRREAERARMAGGSGQAPATRRPGSLVGSDPFEGALVSVPERRLDDLGQGRPIGGLGPEGRPGQEGAPPRTGAPVQGGLGREATASKGAASPIGREGTPGRAGGRYVIGREGTAQGARLDTGSLIGREGLAGQEGVGSPVERAGLLGREGRRKIVEPTVVPSTRASRRSERFARAEIGREAAGSDVRRPVAGARTATLGAAAALQTDKAGILHGLIWHEILSQPLALRHRRGR